MLRVILAPLGGFVGLVGLVGLVTLGGCASDPNETAREHSVGVCMSAERRGELAAAEAACSNALTIVRRANMGKGHEATALYDLARVKRRTGKLGEAEAAFKESLVLEEQLSGPRSERTGRRLAELAATLAQAERWNDGLPFAERLATIAGLYSGEERRVVAALLARYADKIKDTNAESAASLRTASDRLGFKDR